MHVLCTPNSSKLKKPADFFNFAFASITKPYGTTFEAKSVTHLKDDTFLVRTSMEYMDSKFIYQSSKAFQVMVMLENQ